MRFFKYALILLLLATFGATVNAGEASRVIAALPEKHPPTVLTDAEIDSYLNALFKRHEKLKWFSAFLVQIKSGGIFKRPVRQQGILKVKLPDQMLLDMSDDGVMIVADGKYLWIYDTDLGEVERWRIEGYKKSGAENLDMAAMLLGADVKTAAEMRELYKISAIYHNGLIDFVLLPIKGKPAERYSKIEFSIAEDALLPVRTVMTGILQEGGTQPPAVVEYKISNLTSNLTGLKPFAPSTFVFPLAADMEIHDMAPDGAETIVPYETVKKELESRGPASGDHTPEKGLEEQE